MISILANNGKQQYGLQEYLCDAPEDILFLPQDAVPGSTALVTSTLSSYILNNHRQWVAVIGAGGSGSSEGGIDGKSAYEIAVEHGYVGTEEEWLESLQGKPGATPSIGENGNWWIGDEDTGVYVGENIIQADDIDTIVFDAENKYIYAVKGEEKILLTSEQSITSEQIKSLFE